jgi:hypothetical protein
MFIKRKLLAGAAAVSVIGGLGVTAATGAHAATPSCGNGCPAYYSKDVGPSAVTSVFKRVAKPGQKIILFRPSNTDSGEDFTYYRQGTVQAFYKAGLVSAALNLHYGKDMAFELEYTPYGAPTDLCVGVGSTASDLTPVSLQWCGASAKTVWVMDKADAKYGYQPLLNGSGTNFSHPYALTNQGGTLITLRLEKFSDGTVFDTQLWSYKSGVL